MNLDIYKTKDYILNFIIKFKKFKKNHRDLFLNFKYIFGILICNFLILTIWVNRVNFYPENFILWVQGRIASAKFGGKFPCDIKGNKISYENFKFFDNNMVVLSDGAYNIVGKNGSIIRTESHNFSNPSLKTSGIRSIIFDCGGKDYKIESTAQTIYSGESEKKIISCDISDVGSYVIAQESTSHLSEMVVYGKNNAEKYRYFFSEYYLTDVSIDTFGKNAFVSAIFSVDETVSSKMYILNFKSLSPIAEFDLNDNMVSQIKYTSNGNIIAIGDKYIAFINIKSKNVKKVFYKNKILKFFDYNPENGICCCLSSSVNDSNDDEILMLNLDGKQLFRIESKENFIGLSHNNSRTVGLSKNKLIVLNSSGNITGYLNINANVKKAMISSNSKVYTMEYGKIDKIKLKKLQKYKY